MNRAQRARRVLALLRRLYPDARCALDFKNPLELLVATVLSAQCTDKRVNEVTPALFKKCRAACDYARAVPAELEGLVRSTGFFRAKAKSLRGIGQVLCSRFGGRVPDSMDDLLVLPGVARKTANVVLGSAFGRNEGIAVDRHVMRLSYRLALSDREEPVGVEADLMAALPRPSWTFFSLALIRHGRAVCTARDPDCPGCGLNAVCPKRGV